MMNDKEECAMWECDVIQDEPCELCDHCDNHCQCDCDFCLNEYEGYIYVDAHGHDGSVAQIKVPCPVCKLLGLTQRRRNNNE